MLFDSKKDKSITKTHGTITWWKIGVGIALLVVGFASGAVYLGDIKNMVAAFGLIIGLSAGGAFIYWSFNRQAPGYIVNNQKLTGRENAIVHFAKQNGNGKDVPVCTRFVYLTKPPRGASLHHVLNLKKHFYEFWNNPVTRKIEPVVLPDKIPFPPGLFKIPAAMQTYKDAIDYSPPTMFQKMAPGMILLGMGIVGLLMVITGG